MDDPLINCIMCKNATPESFLRKHLAFHHMANGDDIVEKLFQMHFPTRDIECQTPVSWISELEEKETKEFDDSEKEVNGETEDLKIPPKQDFQNGSEFLFGVIVNETEPEERRMENIAEAKQTKSKLRGPKCVRKRRESYESEVEEPDYKIIDSLLKETSANSLVTRFRCQYCHKAHHDKELIGQHIIYDHSIPSTSKKCPRYKKSKKQKMIVQILNSDKVDKQLIEMYHETKRPLEQLPSCLESADDSKEVRAENDTDQFLTNDNFDIDNNEAFYDDGDTFSEAQEDWEACDATLPIGWMYSYSAGHKTYKSPCGEVLYSREKIVDFMLGKGLEIYHPKGYSGLTAQNIDCDGYCEGACDAFKIYRKYYKPFDPNRIRKETKINFVDDQSTHFIRDSLIQIQIKPESDLKPITAFPAVIKGIRPWIICVKEENELNDNEFNRRAVPQSISKAVGNIAKKKVVKRKRSESTESSNCHNSGIENSSTCSSRESTPSGLSRVSKQRRHNKKQTEYEAIYVQCCKKSCQKWRLVTQYEDASHVPDYWVCSMNRDKENSKCGVGGNAFNGDSDKIEIKFSCGSLVWAKLKGFPWWPGMIDFCPDSDDYFWVDEDISEREPAWYHVVFFEGKGTEVTRAWIKSGDIVSMKTPIQQPNGNTLKKPGPLKKRLLNAMHIAEEAKKLKRSERVKKYSFEKLSSSNELNKDRKKRIKITPEPCSKNLPKHISKPSSRPVKQVNQSKKQFIPASFLNPVFSDESDKSDMSDQEDANLAMKKPVVVESNDFNVNPEKEINIDPNSSTIKGQGNNEFDLLSEIMQKYSDETETEKRKEYNILDDDFSVSGSDNEDNANDASLEESSDVGVSSFVIKEENIDSNLNDTGPQIQSVTSQCITEMFIKPEELVSTFNPNLDKVFPKPPLPSDVLIAIAVRNLDPNNDFGTTESDIVSFLTIHFPYYNRNIEECKEMVANARENDDKTEKHVFHIQSSTFTEISQKIEKLLEKNKSLVLDSMLIQGFLDSMVEKFRKDFKCEAVSFRPPYSCKMLSYLAFITLCPPISMGQVMTFLKFLFPSLLGKNTFEIEDLEEWIKNDEHVQDLTTPTGEKLFLLKEGVYPTVLHQVRQFFSTKSNFTRLNKSILKTEFVEFLLPNLLGS